MISQYQWLHYAYRILTLSFLPTIQIHTLSKFFRHESTSINPAIEPQPDRRRKWIYIYKHPMDGLKAMMAQRTIKLLFHLDPKERVAWAVARNDPWLVEELAIRGHECEVPNVSI